MTHAGARVLVVDDEKLIRWTVSSRLERSGYRVRSAETGDEAIHAVLEESPDLMLLDVNLPGTDGLTVLLKALALNPDLTVLMMSAHSTVDMAVEAMKRGATDFLVKPFPLQAMEAAVERALAIGGMRRQIAGLTTERKGGHGSSIVGKSTAMEQVRLMVTRVAASETATVLIEGESGSGKEVVARGIHFEGSRADRPFLQLNCAALPEHLLESEFFGHERGSFTDAHAQKRGLFESAEGGSVFLDEIGELRASGQVKLLQLLENKTFRRVGGVHELRADVRVIAATNVDLEEAVTEGRFRADLFFRLNVVRIRIPPLREHAEDIPSLAAHFIVKFNREMKREVHGVASAALDALVRYRWPGNVRELRNVIERALILHPQADEVRLEHLPDEVQRPAPSREPEAESPPPRATALDPAATLDGVERRLIKEALERTRHNQSLAARLLGISRDTMRYRMKKHGIQ
jgi:DNA-binding NtrC family response regulator